LVIEVGAINQIIGLRPETNKGQRFKSPKAKKKRTKKKTNPHQTKKQKKKTEEATQPPQKSERETNG